MSFLRQSTKTNMTRGVILAALLGSSFTACASERAANAAVTQTVSSNDGTLVVSFDAKGTAVGWDFGAVQALVERTDASKIKQYVFAGSSSGSLPAAYYACYGLTKETADSARIQLTDWASKKLLNEHTKAKLIQLMLGEETDSSYENMMGIVNIVTKNGTCMPQYPLLIPAANMEVLDQRKGGPLGTQGDKVVDLANFDVIQNGKKIGKACTYFVDDSLFRSLSALKPEERLCDLRRINTPEDLLMAIRASVSEPTYFAPVTDHNPGAIQSAYGVISKRVYNGGYVFMSPVQDIKRVMPDAALFGTGRGFFSRAQNRIVQSWYSLDMNRAQLDARWFFDTQMQFTDKEWAKLGEITVVEQATLGYARAKQCLQDSKSCNSKLIKRPTLDKDVAGQPLEPKTRRGIDSLLKQETMLSRFL